jgi:hypothetical protein
MTIVTLYALIGEDLKVMFTSRATDIVFMVITSISFFLFLFEIVFTTIGKKEYLNSFFFWLDIVSTLSLITDIDPIWSRIIGDVHED